MCHISYVYVNFKSLCHNGQYIVVPVIQETWGDEAGSSVAYFSDLEDPQYGTVYQGVPNSPKGHCGKTFAIIKKMNTEKRYKNKSWVIIMDDDTLVRCAALLHMALSM